VENNLRNEGPGSKVLLAVALLTSLYWLFGLFYNPYTIKLTGILFEILWVPMILSLLIIPIFCLYKIISKTKDRLYYILSLVLAGSTIALLIFK